MDKVTSRLIRELIGYTAASVVALAVDLAVLVLLTESGVHYLVAATTAFLAGMFVVYLASVKWIFSWRTHRERRHIEAGVFLATGAIGLLLNLGIMWTLTSALGFYYLYSKLVSVGVVFAWHFVSRKLILFTHWNKA
jgi:putative flippase GtrA